MNKREFLKVGLLGMGALAISPKASALKYYPNTSISKKKWAVIYGTWCGSARDAGLWISEGMRGVADVFDVRENPDISKYDYVIIGSAIRSNKVTDELDQYIAKNRSLIKSKLVGLYVVAGNMMRPFTAEQKATLLDNYLFKLCDVKDVMSAAFLGRVTLGLMDKAAYEMMSRMGTSDYDNLKRPECMAFGAEVFDKYDSFSE